MAMAAFKIADWVLLDEVSVHLKQINGGNEDLARLDIQTALVEGCRSLLRWVKDGQEVREYPPPAFWHPSTRLVWDRLPRRLCVRLPRDEHKGDVLYTFLLRTDAARWGLLPALESSQAKQQSKQQRQQRPKKRESAPADTQPQPRASRRRRNQGSGPQTLRARVVLKRMYGGPEGYPTRDEVSDVDLLDRFAKEYEKVEGKANPPSRLKMPSPDTVLREVGRKD
jgi:hypothetical protein